MAAASLAGAVSASPIPLLDLTHHRTPLFSVPHALRLFSCCLNHPRTFSARPVG